MRADGNPANKRHLDVQYSFFRYSDQGCEATPETPGHARDAIDLARVLFGADFSRRIRWCSATSTRIRR